VAEAPHLHSLIFSCACPSSLPACWICNFFPEIIPTAFFSLFSTRSQTSYNVHASVLEAADLHFASSQAGAIVIDNVDRLQAPSRLLWELCGTLRAPRCIHYTLLQHCIELTKD